MVLGSVLVKQSCIYVMLIIVGESLQAPVIIVSAGSKK